MSVCLCTVGRHNLNTDSLETVARQLSDIFGINILWEEWREDHFVELGRIVKHEGQPFYTLDDDSDESANWAVASVYPLRMTQDDSMMLT